MVKIIFTTVLISIILTLDVYIWYAYKSTLLSNPAFKYAYWLVSILTVLLMFYPAINTNLTLYPNYMVVIFGFMFSVIMSKIVMSLPLILDDVIRFFRWLSHIVSDKTNASSSIGGTPISRLQFLKNTAFGLGALALTTLSYGIIVGRFDFKKHFVSLGLPTFKSKKPLRIVQISDLHLGSFQKKDKLEEAIELINNESPDLIFFTGDLVNNRASEAAPFVEILSTLKAKYGKYSVLGNHDYADYIGLDISTEEGKIAWEANHQEILSHHKESGFDLLLNENRLLNFDGQEINLVGVENWGGGRFSKYGDLDVAMQGVKENCPTLLLSHDPTHWQKKVIPHAKQIDLQFAGHTHGMQFGLEIAGIKWSPVKWKYKYWAGLYSKDESHLYVNRGIGHLGYPGRVGILPEITVFEIKSI